MSQVRLCDFCGFSTRNVQTSTVAQVKLPTAAAPEVVKGTGNITELDICVTCQPAMRDMLTAWSEVRHEERERQERAQAKEEKL